MSVKLLPLNSGVQEKHLPSFDGQLSNFQLPALALSLSRGIFISPFRVVRVA